MQSNVTLNNSLLHGGPSRRRWTNWWIGFHLAALIRSGENGFWAATLFSHVASMPYELKVLILTGGDSTVDLSDMALKLFFQFSELLPNRLPEKTQSRLGD